MKDKFMQRRFKSVLSLILLFSFYAGVFADVKVRQKMTTGGSSFETTKMIKGARRRTEQKSDAGGGASDYMAQVATIEQCDLRRTVQINDRKKLYFSEPFADSPADPNDAARQNSSSRNRDQKGGTVTIIYRVTDTGERKTFFGLPARHLKIVQETESSSDSCGGANKSRMEIDGWYVDFSAEFNCPLNAPQTPRGITDKPDCRDRVIYKSTGSVKTGFLLSGMTVFYDGSGNKTMSQTIETLEISRSLLPAALFDVPADYRSASSADELYIMPDISDLIRQQKNDEEESMPSDRGTKSIGLYIVFGSEARVNQSEISRHVLDKLRGRNFNARTGTVTGDRSDYILNIEIIKVKESTASKAGGIFGKVTGIETKAGQTEIEIVMTLAKTASGVPLKQAREARKYSGDSSAALKTALNELLNNILTEIPN